jgi:glycosyltransferase involved in cell wall biosynthesis
LLDPLTPLNSVSDLAGKRLLRILLISTADSGGGAELSAWNLFNAYRMRGHSARLLVGRKRMADPDVIEIGNDAARTPWAQFWIRTGDRLKPYESQGYGAGRLRELAHWVGEPIRRLDISRGHEDFHYPGTWRALESVPFDIVHCYNLHGGYFDLRILPSLTRRHRVILDLRDAWLLSGHCAHSLDCDRWKTGCGHCPNLRIYPAIRRDGTAFNWRRKRRILGDSRLCIATPSQWMMNKVGESMFASSVSQSRVVPTGIDLTIFKPAPKEQVRAALKIPADARVLLFVAMAPRRNVWKDYGMLSSTVEQLSRRFAHRKLLLIALGDTSATEARTDGNIRFVPHLKKAEDVAAYYQAADLYLHAAVADTFPRAVLEALACGVPVVATGVGGIPEQIRSLVAESGPDALRATGIVVPPGDVQAMTGAVERLLADEPLRLTLAANAAADARDRFDLQQQAERYLSWYESLIPN